MINECGNCQYIDSSKTRQGFVWCRHGKRWMPYHSTALRKNCHSNFARQWLSKTYWGQQIKLEAERKNKQKAELKLKDSFEQLGFKIDVQKIAKKNIDELF